MFVNRGSTILLGLSLVAIGVGLEGVRIQDSFVVHQAIPFVLGLSQQGVVFRVANNLMGFCHLDFPWFWKGVLDFLFNILTHDVIIQLRVSFTVESEASDLAFDLSFIRSVAIILGSSADEFFDVACHKKKKETELQLSHLIMTFAVAVATRR